MRTARHQMSAVVGDPQVNKFEQVSNLGHQMTLVEGMGPCTEGVVYSEVQCVMDNGNRGTPWTEWCTDTTENNTFLRLRW